MSDRLQKLYEVTPEGEIKSGTYFDGDNAAYVSRSKDSKEISIDGSVNSEHLLFFAELMGNKTISKMEQQMIELGFMLDRYAFQLQHVENLRFALARCTSQLQHVEHLRGVNAPITPATLSPEIITESWALLAKTGSFESKSKKS